MEIESTTPSLGITKDNGSDFEIFLHFQIQFMNTCNILWIKSLQKIFLALASTHLNRDPIPRENHATLYTINNTIYLPTSSSNDSPHSRFHL